MYTIYQFHLLQIPQRPRSEALQALYAEKGDELNVNLTKQSSPLYYVPPEAYTTKATKAESFRPVKAPPAPPLPHHNQVSVFSTYQNKIFLTFRSIHKYTSTFLQLCYTLILNIKPICL